MSKLFTPIGLVLGSSRARSPRVVRGMVDHGTRHGWAQLTGEWPGEERPEEE